MSHLVINLKSNNKGKFEYKPGEILSGIVQLTLSKPTKVKEIYIRILGEAYAKWSAFGYIRRIVYISSEPLIDAKISLIGNHNGPKFTLEPGVYKYNFEYKLPENIPDSLFVKHQILDEIFGTISYKIEAVLDKTWTNRKSLEFKVIRDDDLNANPKLMEPLECFGKKNFFFFFNKYKTIQMTASIPYRGFTLTQCIPITIDYKNDSIIDVRETSVKFIQTVYLVHSWNKNPKSETIEKVLFERLADGVKARHSKTLTVELPVPETFKSSYLYSHVIMVAHSIEITAKVDSKFRTNKSVRLPITIGNIPLRFNINNTQ